MEQKQSERQKYWQVVIADPAIVRMTMVRPDGETATAGLPSLPPPGDGPAPRRPRRRAHDGSEASIG